MSDIPWQRGGNAAYPGKHVGLKCAPLHSPRADDQYWLGYMASNRGGRGTISPLDRI